MTEKTEKMDLRDLSDEISGDLDYARALLSAAVDKTVFYLENKKLLGPYKDLLYSCALELESLVSLAGHFLERMDGDMRAVADIAYASNSPKSE